MKIYPIGIAGESNYQDAISRCHQGEAVRIFHEKDNPYDPFALRVDNNIGECIGYIPRASWLRRAIHDEGRGVTASVKSLSDGGEGIVGVVIDVTLTDDAVFERSYREDRQLKPNDQDLVRQHIQTILDASQLPITCQCDFEFSVSAPGLTTSTPINCKACGRVEFLDEETIFVVEVEFLHGVTTYLAGLELDVPDAEVLLKLFRKAERHPEPIPPTLMPDEKRSTFARLKEAFRKKV